MKRNTFLDRLNPFAPRAIHSTRRRCGPHSPRRLAFEGLESKNLLAVNPLVVTSAADNIADDGVLTLREAILEANADPDTDTINFNIPGGGAQTITLLEALPGITETVIIDGPTTDPDDTPLITIDAGAVTAWVPMYLQGDAGGSELRNFRIINASDTALALYHDTGGNKIENLDLSGAGRRAIHIEESDCNEISNNDVSGDVSDTTIRGIHLVSADCNTISNNNASGVKYGIDLNNSNYNTVVGNDFSDTSSGIKATFGEYTGIHIEEVLVVKGDNVFTNVGTALTFTGLHDIDLVHGSDFDIDVRDAVNGLTLIDALNVTIDGFDLSGDVTRSDDIGLWVRGASTNVTINDIVARDRGAGIVLYDLAGGEISHADLSWSGASSVGYGLWIVRGNGISVQDVVIANHASGMEFAGTHNVTVECSRIVDNMRGVSAYDSGEIATTNLILYNNQIEGNTQHGISNSSASTVNAENNYWGASDGPSNLGGSGDSYSGLVDADPFLTELPPCFDTTPPEIIGVDVSTDLHALIVQLNDDDLDPTEAQNSANYKLTVAGVDGVFGTDDDENVAIDSIIYDAATDVITVQTSETLFDAVFRLTIDGDDGIDDGTPGIADLSGNFLSGGDFTAELDMTTFSLIEDTLTTLEEMGLSTGTENSLIGKLETAVKVLGTEANGNGVLALMDAFRRGILHQFDRGQLTEDQRDELLADTDLIILGITLTAA